MLKLKHRISRKNAEMLIKMLEDSRFGKSPQMTVEEAMKLSPIYISPAGGYEIYAIQFGDVTMLFRFRDGTVTMKEQCW